MYIYIYIYHCVPQTHPGGLLNFTDFFFAVVIAAQCETPGSNLSGSGRDCWWGLRCVCGYVKRDTYKLLKSKQTTVFSIVSSTYSRCYVIGDADKMLDRASAWALGRDSGSLS